MAELTEAEAYEYELDYFKARLDDPSLLDRAVRFKGLLAVPVGGKRRGGFLSLADAAMCEGAIADLAGRDGFPDVRYEYTQVPADELGDAEEYHLVRWGDDEPDPSDVTFLQHEIDEGRHYGYSELAIGRYIDENLNR